MAEIAGKENAVAQIDAGGHQNGARVLRSLENNVPSTATPSKGDSGGHALQAACIDPLSLESSFSSPGGSADKAWTNPMFSSMYSRGHSGHVTQRRAEASGAVELAEQLAAAQQQLAAAAAQLAEAQLRERPAVNLVINVVEEGEAGSLGTANVQAAGVQQQQQQSQQLQRSEALVAELSKHAGQLKGKIAKLEGAVAAGQSKVRAQAQELEELKSTNKELEVQLRQAQQQIGVTPERSRSALRELQERAERATEASAQHEQRITRLQSVLAYDGSEREELQEFTALEFGICTEEERSLRAEVERLREAGEAAAAELAELRGRLVDAQTSLVQREDEVQELRQQLRGSQEALEAAQSTGSQWQTRAEAYDRDRQQAAANVRKAEREVDLIAQENAAMFRQVNFVRARLVAQLSQLEGAVPDIAKLARELQAWCDKEAAHRKNGCGLTPR